MRMHKNCPNTKVRSRHAVKPVAVKPVVMLTAHWAGNGRTLRQATFVVYLNQKKISRIVQGEIYEKSNIIISCISSFNNWL